MPILTSPSLLLRRFVFRMAEASARQDFTNHRCCFAMMRDGVILRVKKREVAVASMKANDNSDWLGCTHTPTTQCKGNLISHLLQNSEQFLFSRKQFVIFYYFSFNRGLMKDVLSIISQIICLCHYVFEKAS